MKKEIIVLRDDELKWPLSPNGSDPYYSTTNSRPYPISIPVDPFPCYRHKHELVRSTLDQVYNAFPIGVDFQLYILPFEDRSRVNGQATQLYDYDQAQKDDKGRFPWIGIICLFGKRIPLHPGMTRYLVSHEYGHLVHHWIEHEMCIDTSRGLSTFEDDYAAMRKVDHSNNAGGRTWHRSVREIIVNDFRVCVCNVEPEFWPHDCDHPNDVKIVKDFWADMVEKYSFKSL